jgi:putative membrane-bound dehydrogenase-like protein
MKTLAQHVIPWLIAMALPFRAVAGEPPVDVPAFPRVAPIPADRAGESFAIRDGFTMELLAAEPLVMDPVDLAYDENGSAYVAEMRDYPLPERPGLRPSSVPGRVRLLIDDDGDGRFDQSHVFADGLAWPTSVACWRQGVYVAAAPDLWYFKDTDGDHRADVRERVLTGFGTENVQAIVNNLKWGPDHALYGAASGNGGSIRPAGQPEAAPVNVTRRDFRFDPKTGGIAAVSGSARFGNTFDDWGNRFICNIRNPIQHVVLPSHYLARNPLLLVPATVCDVAAAGDQVPVYRTSAPEPWREFRARRWVKERMNYPRSELVGAGFFTSSSGVTVYRGSAYPESYHGNVFVGEVAANLIHREVMTEAGATFSARPAEEGIEFLTSTDNWFRPVNFVNAPDGTLHVLDMYREFIEHPWSIPDDIKSRLDLSSGNDRGRIYRLRPPGFSPRPPPRLGTAGTEELVGLLCHPDGWWRETAGRLLVERQDPAATAPLRKLFRTCEFPQGRLAAVWCLHALSELDEATLERALSDRHSAIREPALRIAEPRLATSASLRRKAVGLADDESARVRFQAAFTLGVIDGEDALAGLAGIARRDAGDLWVRIAILSSSGGRSVPLMKLLLRSPPSGREGADLLAELAFLAGAEAGESARREVLAALEAGGGNDLGLSFAVLEGLARGLARSGLKLTAKEHDATRGIADRLFELAGSIVTDPGLPADDRVRAIRLLAHDGTGEAADRLMACLEARQPSAVQSAAIRALSGLKPDGLASRVLDRWPAFTPPSQHAVVEVLLGRPEWTVLLLEAVARGEIDAAHVPVLRRTLLLASTNPRIQTLARQLFADPQTTARDRVIADYGAFSARPGDASRGRSVFVRECAACHAVGGRRIVPPGEPNVPFAGVGPDMGSVRNRSPEEVLVHVLDPNREVAPNFMAYVATLADGRVVVGIVASETDSTITLSSQAGQETLLRADLDDLAATGKSLMPEGLETRITPEEMADLMAFILTM